MVVRNIKKIKWIILFSLLCTFSGCWRTLKINGKKQLFLPHETVKIKVTAKFNMRLFYIIEIQSTKGDIEVHPKELKLTPIPLADTIIVSGAYYKKKAMRQPFVLKQGETFRYNFDVYPLLDTLDRYLIPNQIHILPGNFITYKGIPLIIDTIKIEVR